MRFDFKMILKERKGVHDFSRLTNRYFLFHFSFLWDIFLEVEIFLKLNRHIKAIENSWEEYLKSRDMQCLTKIDIIGVHFNETSINLSNQQLFISILFLFPLLVLEKHRTRYQLLLSPYRYMPI